MKVQNTITRTDKKREELKNAFAAYTIENINGTERMQVAIQLGVHVRTIERYLTGEVRKVAFGELLLSTIKKFMANNKTASAA